MQFCLHSVARQGVGTSRVANFFRWDWILTTGDPLLIDSHSFGLLLLFLLFLLNAAPANELHIVGMREEKASLSAQNHLVHIHSLGFPAIVNSRVLAQYSLKLLFTDKSVHFEMLAQHRNSCIQQPCRLRIVQFPEVVALREHDGWLVGINSSLSEGALDTGLAECFVEIHSAVSNGLPDGAKACWLHHRLQIRFELLKASGLGSSKSSPYLKPVDE